MRHIFSLCILKFGIIFLFPCATTFVTFASEPELTGSSVWRISKGDNTMFLAGSIHLLREGDFPLPRELDLAFAQSTALALEADIRQKAVGELQSYLMSQMFLPEGQTLETLLEASTLKKLRIAALRYGIPLETVSHFKPSMLMSALAVLQIQSLGFVQEGVDHYYLHKAVNANKFLYFLEAAENQVDAILSMGVGYENDFVLYSLQDMENVEAFLTSILNDWRTGEAATSEATLKSMKRNFPLIYQVIVTDRHDAWMPQLEKFLTSDSIYFVIVGLLHIHGPDGLLQLLKDLGYTVEQLK
ncbi:MAG: TraB/GumN family protein [Fibromonadaceae bacterium]|jgi:uncharacterized protein YbaP (TraB family)|nr:TraB/GumN family protein [Fibromonadaceae bacterium]